MSSTADRLGEIVGDRLCARCGFNLSGQTIVREPHYKLLIVRCPECGAPAALQEYPLLGLWANRLGYVFAGLVLIHVFALIVGASMANWGFAETGVQMMSRKYSEFIQSAYAKANQGPQPGFGYTYFNQDWWNAIDKWDMFQQAGSWRGAIAWRSLLILIPHGAILSCFGMVFAIVAPHTRGLLRLAFPIFVLLLSGVFMTISFAGSPWAYHSGLAAMRQLWPVLAPPILLFGGCALLIGMFAGRPIARFLTALMLPPRLRGPLGYLWRADGKPMPRPAR